MFQNWTFAKELAAGYGLAGLTLLLVGATAYRTTEGLVANDDLVNHTYLVKERLGNLLSDLVDVETGTRGYVITGIDSFLEPYRSGAGAVKAHLNELQQLTVDNPSQQRRLAAVQQAIATSLDFRHAPSRCARAMASTAPRSSSQPAPARRRWIGSGPSSPRPDERRRIFSPPAKPPRNRARR